MPEGDTIYRAAQTLHRVLAGRTVTRFESVYPAVSRVAEDHPVVGRTVESVSARGKHLLIAFSGDLVLRTHMRMNGSWHIYRAGDRWQRPARDMRVLVATVEAVAVGFNVPVAELLTRRELVRHKELRALGPDWLDPAFDRTEALRRVREHTGEAIADVLLNQRVTAGIGNVLKSEILFLAGIHPFTPVSAIGEERLQRLVDFAREQLAANVRSRAQTLVPFTGRRTTRSMDPNRKLWVYGRCGQACRRCGAAIESRKTGLDARITYWCPRCQPGSGG
jgi:endonuclease VIII